MSQKTIADDPRLTAFVLNELSPADRAAFERQLADSPETAAEVALIREMADELRTALQSEPALPQTDFVMPARLVTSDAKVPSVGSVSDSFSPRHRWTSRVAVAASCLALLGTFSWVAWSGRAPSNIEDRLALAEYDAMGSHDSRDVTMRNLSLAQRQLGEQLHEVESFSVAEGAQPGPIVAWSDNASDYAVHDPQAHSWRFRSLNRDGAERFARQKARGSDAYFYKELKQLSDLAPTVRLYALPALAGSQESKKRPDESDEFALRRKSLGLEKQVDELLEIEKLRRESEVVANAEAYAAIHDNPFASPLAEPLSTFSIDVDTAAYSNMRRFLTQGSWPPADSVRIEELVNYFSYDYTPPGAEDSKRKAEGSTDDKALPDQPFAVHMEVAGCPWNADHRLVRVGLKGKEIALDKRPVSNIVFLIDVSGSMQDANKLPLVKAGLRRLVEQFNENDRVGIVVYAGASGLVLDSTNATQKDVILSSIENLQAGGSTNGGEGIQLAYALARKHFIEKGTNRVILCTDGDFNVGITNQDDLTRLIEEESKSGVFLSVLGFGMGNLKDSTLEKLADKGNGNYAYIDTLREANKVFVEQMTGTLITIAKDVKIQIEFNPSQVGAYRLIGYENRMLAAQDFHDDTKDAGEIGAGHTVTALYEIIPPSKLPAPTKVPVVEEKLKYQPNVKSPAQAEGQGLRDKGKNEGQEQRVGGQEQNTSVRPSVLSPQPSANPELLTMKLRYKQPDADKSSLIEMPLTDGGKSFAQASTDFRFAASVASFGMILRHSPHRGNATLDAVAEIAQSSLGTDKSGYRSEFVGLVRSAKALQK